MTIKKEAIIVFFISQSCLILNIQEYHLEQGGALSPTTNRINREFKSFIKIGGNCEIIGFLLTIGPHSGLVKVALNGSESYTINTWDRWCHYTRRHFRLSMKISKKAQINILQTNFDTSSCKNQIDFKTVKKKLIVHDIYYVGNDLTVDNIHDGCMIEKAFTD